MMQSHRRGWVLLSFVLVLAMLLSACAARPELPAAAPAEEGAAPAEEAAAPAEEATSEEAAPAEEYTGLEAPMLAEMVAAGELPPLEERLPLEPLVVEPYESIGKYGGTWHRAFRGVKDFHAWGRINYDPILRWAPTGTNEVLPGLAKDWEWNEEGTELTLYFREGLKWSDGEPFTVDDIIFWWEAIETDTNITPAVHLEWTVDGEPMTLEKIDDYTIKYVFPSPTGIVETMGLAFHGTQWPLGFERFGAFAPKHYLEQFHPAYNDEYTDYATFEEKAFDYNIERPVIWPWMPVQWDPGGTELVLERNPYYWKVDPEGHQLPYIDRVQVALVEDNPAIVVEMAAGNLDMQSRGSTLSDLPVLKDNEEAGDYTVSLWSQDQASIAALQPNQSYDDPKYRELFQNRSFRYALSNALDRNLINDIAYFGQAVPTAESVAQTVSWYVPELAMFQSEYNPDEAKRLLDEEVGLVMGNDGFYTFPDGSDLTLVIEAVGGEYDALLELVVEQWKAVGLNTTLKLMNRDLYWPRAIGNQVMINVWGTGSAFPLMNPDNLLAYNEKSFWAPQYGIYYQTGGASGEDAPESMKEGQRLFDEIMVTADPDKQRELGQELVRNATEEMWVINTVGGMPIPVVVKNNFKNVWAGPDYMASWIVMTPGNQDPPTYYFDD